MMTLTRTAGLLVAAIAAAAVVASPASARPWHRHQGWHGGGAGAAIGFATGAIIGSALAPRPYYYGGPYAYAPGPVVGNDDAYCLQRFKSYDPASGTYLGYDGQRHPCP